jgi:hypothetical protein
MKLLAKVAVGVSTATLAVTLLGGVAGANQWNTLPSTYSAPALIISSTTRHETTSGGSEVLVQLNNHLAGQEWQLFHANTVNPITGTTAINGVYSTEVDGNLANGTAFNNAWSSTTAGNFTGNEFY